MEHRAELTFSAVDSISLLIMPPSSSEGGLGAALVGEKISVNETAVSVTKLLGEGRLSDMTLRCFVSGNANVHMRVSN